MKKIVLLTIIIIISAGHSYTNPIIWAKSSDQIMVAKNYNHANPNVYMYCLTSDTLKQKILLFGSSFAQIHGGINQGGLIAETIIDPKNKFDNIDLENLSVLLKKLLANFSTVSEIMNQNNSMDNKLNKDCKILIADNKGESVIIENGQMYSYKRNYLIATYLPLQEVNYDKEEVPCYRFYIANKMLQKNPVTVKTCRNILVATHREKEGEGTVYSLIYDLKNKKIYAYYLHDFINTKIIDIEEEFKNGDHKAHLSDLFPNFTLTRAENYIKYYELNGLNVIPERPAQIIASIYYTIDSSNYQRINDLFCSKITKHLGTKTFWYKKTFNWKIVKVQIIEEKINNKNAQVQYILGYKINKMFYSTIATDSLILEDGKWKLVLNEINTQHSSQYR